MTRAPHPVVVGVDQGTGSTKAIALDVTGAVLARASRPLRISYPRPGWVEQDPEEILGGVIRVVESLRASLDHPIAAVGLSTQRESALAWDTMTGKPLSPVIGWQDRRTSERVRGRAAQAATIRSLSGLPMDPMFSAPKFEWILDEIDEDRSGCSSGRITLGTVDAWLMARLTGERRIEVGNASRTQLLDLSSAQWSDALMAEFRIPVQALPAVHGSDDPSLPSPALGGAAIAGVLGDSHAALLAHGARRPGLVKVTYGTGSSVMGLHEGRALDGLADTIGWSFDGRIARAFEGNILATGAVLVWLGALLGRSPDEVVRMAEAEPSGPLDIVPAFAGLAAPWWDDRAVGIISGLTLSSSPGELARAAAEAIPLQIEDVLAASEARGASAASELHVDGGPSSNDWLMQLQADISGRVVVRSGVDDMSARGAAWLAGSSVGLWDLEHCPWPAHPRTFSPRSTSPDRAHRRARWRDAVHRATLRNDAQG